MTPRDSGGAGATLVGATFEVEWCPECGLIHLGPDVAWHAFECSEPLLEKYVCRVESPSGAEPTEPTREDSDDA